MIKFKLVDNPSDKKTEFYGWSEKVGKDVKRYGPSPLETQTNFLKHLHAEGFEPFDSDADGFQYWKKRI